MAKSLRSKYKSKESFGVIKNHGSSKKANTSQPFQKGPLVRARGNWERAMGKNKFTNDTLHELPRPPVSLRILQNISTSSVIISSEIQATTQCR